MSSPRPNLDAARVIDPVGFYYSGATAFFASQRDQRFSYCMYVPAAHKTATEPLPLLVLMHGTQRTAERYRNEYREFAAEQDCVVVAPLFPAGVAEPGDLHGFKRIGFGDIRFDHVLLDIIGEIGERFTVRTDKFYLHGFSGGGQFAHRFAYLHPDRLAALSVGAPGRVTRVNPDVPWWLGTGDVRERFGVDLDLATLAAVPIQLVVGAEDTDTWEIAEPGIDAGGDTRIQRLRTLRRNWTDHGITTQFDLVPGVGHRGLDVQPTVKGFMAEMMAKARHAEAS